MAEECWRDGQGQNNEVTFFHFKDVRLFSVHSGEPLMGLESTSDMVRFSMLDRLRSRGQQRLWLEATTPVVNLFQ